MAGRFLAFRERRRRRLLLPGADFRKNLSTTPGADNDNYYFLNKLRLRLGYTASWVNLMVEGRNSSSTGDDRDPNPESDGPIDLQQAYLFIGNHKKFPLSLKIGRQELSYGDERVVGAFAWNNIGRVFDAAKLRWQNEYFAADFFSGRVIIPDDNNLNVPNDYDWFSGLYAGTKLIPKQATELYFCHATPRHNPRLRSGPICRALSTDRPLVIFTRLASASNRIQATLDLGIIAPK